MLTIQEALDVDASTRLVDNYQAAQAQAVVAHTLARVNGAQHCKIEDFNPFSRAIRAQQARDLGIPVAAATVWIELYTSGELPHWVAEYEGDYELLEALAQ